MINIYIINVILFVISTSVVLGANMFSVLYCYGNQKFKYLLIKKHYNYLILITIGAIINFIDFLIIGFNKKDDNLYSLIKLNIVYISDIPFVLLYCYRGLLLADILNKKIKIYKIIYFIIAIYIIYIIFINMLYFYNNSFISINLWKYYLYYFIIGIFTFIYHPIMIVMFIRKSDGNVYKNNRNEFIFNFIVMLFTFSLFIIELFSDFSISPMINIRYYWTITSALFISLFYSINVIIYYFYNERKKENIENNIITSDIMLNATQNYYNNKNHENNNNLDKNIYLNILKIIEEVIKVNKKLYYISNKIILDKTRVLKIKKFEDKYDYMFYVINFLKEELELNIYHRVNLYNSTYNLYNDNFVILILKSSFVDEDIKITNKSPFIKKYILNEKD